MINPGNSATLMKRECDEHTDIATEVTIVLIVGLIAKGLYISVD